MALIQRWAGALVNASWTAKKFLDGSISQYNGNLLYPPNLPDYKSYFFRMSGLSGPELHGYRRARISLSWCNKASKKTLLIFVHLTYRGRPNKRLDRPPFERQRTNALLVRTKFPNASPRLLKVKNPKATWSLRPENGAKEAIFFFWIGSRCLAFVSRQRSLFEACPDSLRFLILKALFLDYQTFYQFSKFFFLPSIPFVSDNFH